MLAVVDTSGFRFVGSNVLSVDFAAQLSWGGTFEGRAQSDISSSLAQLASVVKAQVIAFAASADGGSITLTPPQVLVIGLGDDQITGVRKVSDDATSSTAFTDVPGLTFTLSPNSNYKFAFRGGYTSALTTTALQLSVNGPANPNFMRAVGEIYTAPTAPFGFALGAYDATANPGSGGGATALPFEVEGTISTGATGGAFALRFRSEVNASAVTILRGSFGELVGVG
jgi:hypothetical protein